MFFDELDSIAKARGDSSGDAGVRVIECLTGMNAPSLLVRPKLS